MVVDAATADAPGSWRSGLSANLPVAVYADIAGFSVIVGDVVVDDDCLAPDLLLAPGNIPVVAEILSFPLVHVAIFAARIGAALISRQRSLSSHIVRMPPSQLGCALVGLLCR